MILFARTQRIAILIFDDFEPIDVWGFTEAFHHRAIPRAGIHRSAVSLPGRSRRAGEAAHPLLQRPAGDAGL